MKHDLAQALQGVLVLQQWQNELVQSAIRQLAKTKASASAKGSSKRWSKRKKSK
jgi:hypothetical protein